MLINLAEGEEWDDYEFEETYKKLQRLRKEGKGEPRKYKQLPNYKHEHLSRKGEPYKAEYTVDSRILVHPKWDKRNDRDFVKFMRDVINQTGNYLGKKVEKVLQQNLTKTISEALRKSAISEGQNVPMFVMEGMALKIGKGFKLKGDGRFDTPDNIDELVDTFSAFGSSYLRGFAGETGRLLEAVMDEGETIHRKILEKIGIAARDHMRRVAYKSPEERRGANPSLNVPKYASQMTKEVGGEIKLEKLLKEYTVGRWEGAHPVMRTGHLRESIAFKITMDPRVTGRKKMDRVSRVTYKWTHGGRVKGAEALHDYERETEMAISLQVGPGVGKVPAPHYALVVNDGAGPGATDGSKRQMHYVPSPRKHATGGQGYMARGGSWRGFEGKHYMEDTGMWLVRETPRERMNAVKLAEIYAYRAMAKVKLPPEMSDAIKGDLQRLALEWITRQASVSTKELLADLAAHLLEGFDVGEG